VAKKLITLPLITDTFVERLRQANEKGEAHAGESYLRLPWSQTMERELRACWRNCLAPDDPRFLTDRELGACRRIRSGFDRPFFRLAASGCSHAENKPLEARWGFQTKH